VENETMEVTPPVEIMLIQPQPFLPKPKPRPRPLKAKGGAFLPVLDAEIVPGCDTQSTQRGADVGTGEDDLFIINRRSKRLATKG
jgi:hypothetical protein